MAIRQGGSRKTKGIAIYGQESNFTTWRLAKMNLAIRGIDANLGPQQADSFHSDLHKDLKADFVMANPPFNDSDWGGDRLRQDARWKYGVPPAGNANYAWIQHFIHHLAPNGIAGFVMANGSMSSNQSGEGDIRKVCSTRQDSGHSRRGRLLPSHSCRVDQDSNVGARPFRGGVGRGNSADRLAFGGLGSGRGHFRGGRAQEAGHFDPVGQVSGGSPRNPAPQSGDRTAPPPPPRRDQGPSTPEPGTVPVIRRNVGGRNSEIPEPFD